MTHLRTCILVVGLIAAVPLARADDGQTIGSKMRAILDEGAASGSSSTNKQPPAPPRGVSSSRRTDRRKPAR